MEYYIIGEREVVLAFALVGVKGTYVTNKNQALEAFNNITGQANHVTTMPRTDIPKVLILTEDVSVMLDEQVQAWQLSGKFPLIVEVPGLSGRLSGKKSLTDSIREAVGISV